MTPLIWVDLTFKCLEDVMVFRVFFFIFYFFCLELMVRKDTWMITTTVTVVVIFSKVPFWKLPDRSYV